MVDYNEILAKLVKDMIYEFDDKVKLYRMEEFSDKFQLYFLISGNKEFKFVLGKEAMDSCSYFDIYFGLHCKIKEICEK